LRERGREPSQTPKFPAPFPREGKHLFSVIVALSLTFLGWRRHPHTDKSINTKTAEQTLGGFVIKLQ
jgi:hypothetical protein